MDGEAVLETVRAAGVLGNVAADRADLLARRVGRVEESVRGHRLGDREVRDARLDGDAGTVEVDVEDASMRARETTTPSETGTAPPERPGPGPTRDERDAVLVAEADHRLRLGSRPRQHRRARGNDAVARQAVALVRAELVGLLHDGVRAQRDDGCIDEPGGKRHGASVTSGRRFHRAPVVSTNSAFTRMKTDARWRSGGGQAPGPPTRRLRCPGARVDRVRRAAPLEESRAEGSHAEHAHRLASLERG